jgi:uncharacterized SAM-binding protein YcdF (DUF218 family)
LASPKPDSGGIVAIMVVVDSSKPVSDSALAPRLATGANHVWLRRMIRLGTWTFALGGAAFLGGLAQFAANLPQDAGRPSMRADAVVALTGGAQRIADGVALVTSGDGKRLLISGINEKAGRDEIVRHTPALADIMGCCVDLDYRARNTIGNAIEARRWARARGYRSIVVVTSNYHMPRTLAEFAHAMPGMQLVPHPVITDSVDVRRWWSSLHSGRVVASEYVKYVISQGRMLVETDPETSRFAIVIGGRKPISPKGAVESGAGS